MVKDIKIISMIVLLTLAMFVSVAEKAFAIDHFVEKQLLDKSAYWQKRGEVYQARQALKKLLELDPNNAKALSRLATLESKAGDKALADTYVQRLKQSHPHDADILKRNGLNKPPIQPTKSLLTRAREAAGRKSYHQALKLYRRYFGKSTPKGDLALEYYQTAAAAKQWEMARKGFEELVKVSPNNDKYAFILAQHLTYKNTSRLRGIAMLKHLASKSKNNKRIVSAWKKALIWLPVQKASVPEYESYLSQVGRDKKISSLIEQAKAPPKIKPFDLKRKHAFDVLNHGSAVKAGSLFAELLKHHPRDADLNGGLGVALLKQEKFFGAEKYLAKSIQLDRTGSKKWGNAYKSAKYWNILNQAKSDVRTRKLERAEIRLKRAISILPNEAQGYVLLADVQSKRGEEDNAIRTLERLKGVSPNHYGAQLALTRLEVKHHAPNAIDNALMLLEEYPGREGSSQLFMDAYEHSSNAAKHRVEQRAQDALEGNVLANPENVWARMDLAKWYRQTGQDEKALSLLSGLIRAYPEMVEAKYMKAQIHADHEDWDAANAVMHGIAKEDFTENMRTFEQKVSLKRKLAQAHILFQSGRKDEAIRMLDSVDEHDALLDVQGLTLLANTWSAIGQPVRALRIGRRIMKGAVKSDYKSKLLYTSILLAANEDAEADIWIKHLLTKRHEMTVEQQKSLIELARGHAVAQSDKLRKKKAYAQAWDYLAPYLDNELTNTSILLALARIYHDAGRDSEALDIYQSILASSPNDGDTLEAATYSAIAIKDFELANNLVHQGISLEPNHERFYILLGRLERAQGHDVRALQAFQEAERLRRLKELQDGSQENLDNQHYRRSLKNPFLPDASTSEPQVRFLPSYDRSKFTRHVPPPTHSQVILPSRSVSSFTPSSPSVRSNLIEDNQLPRVFSPFAKKITGRNEARVFAPVRRQVRNNTFVTHSRREGRGSAVHHEIEDIKASLSTVASAGLDIHNRQGEAGLSEFTNIETPLQLRLRPSGDKLTLKFVPAVLSAGTLNLSNANLGRRFGTNDINTPLPQATQIAQRDGGVALHADYELEHLMFDLGVSPLGLSVTNFVGGVKYNTSFDDLKLNVGLERRSVTESFLSYAGARDPGTNQIWGGVVRNALFAGFDFSASNGIGIYAKAEYDRLTGKNVLGNSAFKLSGGGYTSFLRDQRADVKAGVYLSLQGYANNLQYYTFGHGGYFSPQQYASVAFPISYSNTEGALSYQFSGYFGLQMFQEDSIAYFPNDAALQAISGRVYNSSTTVGFLGGIKGAAEYVLTPEISVGGSLGFENAQNYNQLNFGAYLHYRFDGLTRLPAFSIEPVHGFFERGS